MNQPGNNRSWLPLAIVFFLTAIVALVLSCTEACGQTYTIDYGEFEGTDRNETVRRIHQSLREFEAVAGWDFRWVPLHEKSDLRFEFYGYGERQLWAYGLDDKGNRISRWGDPRIVRNAYNLGLAHKNGLIYLLSDRPISEAATFGLVRHEVGHVLVWGTSYHSGNTDDLMHPNLTTFYPSPKEVRDIQRRWGPPKLEFHPVPRMEQGAKVRAAKSKWEQLKADRQTAQDQGTWRPEMQSDVLKSLDALVAENNKWWQITNEWNRVPGVIRIPAGRQELQSSPASGSTLLPTTEAPTKCFPAELGGSEANPGIGPASDGD